MPILTAGLLACTVAAVAGVESDIVSQAESLYSQGEYLLVIDLLELALSDTVGVAREERVVLLRLLGSSYVAVGNTESARSQFRDMLLLDPDIDMDPLSTSPKILSVFREVKAELARVPPDTSAPRPAALKPREGVWVGPALKSLILPGLGQFENGDQTKGVIFISSQAASLAGLVVSQMRYTDARRFYAENTDPERMAELYDKYNMWFVIRNGFAAASVGICIVSSVDAIIGAYEREIEEKERTLGFAPIQGGVYVYVRF
jgi:hypothetical protein